MKFKDLPQLLPWFRPKPVRYGHEEIRLDLGEFGSIDYAKWNHALWSIKPPSEQDIKVLKTFLSDGDVAIDIGAHQGDTSVAIAMALGPSGKVLAFEPNSFVLPVLRRNSELNPGKLNIEVYPYAATEIDGSFTFWYSDEGYHNGGSHGDLSRLNHGHMMPLEVEGRNLPRLLSQQPEAVARLKFVKVDTEGHDLAVLKSMEDLLRQQMPFVRAEMYMRWDAAQRAEMLNFFKSLGYAVRRWGDDLFGPEIEVDDLMKLKHFDVFAVPRSSGFYRAGSVQ